jgi:phosphoglycolate phosphatase-like HAD superfamily hydrolase
MEHAGVCIYAIVLRMKVPRAIISDADGTLIDTVHLIRRGQYETIKQYLLQQGFELHKIPTYDTFETVLHETLGGSAHDTLRRTIERLYQDDSKLLATFDYDALHDLLNPTQDEIAPEYVKAYSGLSTLLFELGAADIALAIFTSGTPHHVVRNFGVALPEIGLQDLFHDKAISDREKLDIFERTFAKHFSLPAFMVVTCDDVSTHKPNPDSFNLAMRRLGVTPDVTAALGDHKVDMEAGVNAHAQTRIGITHGFGDRQSLMAAGATLIVDSLDELTKELKRGE